jgi:hypothetical protein
LCVPVKNCACAEREEHRTDSRGNDDCHGIS